MRVDLICGKCRHRWFYEGADPLLALQRHGELTHPDDVTVPLSATTRDLPSETVGA